MYVAKINVFSHVLNNECRNSDFVIMIKIKKSYIDNILLIIIMYFRCRKCKRNRCKIKFNRIKKNLKNISLLFNEFNSLIIINIFKHNR